MFYTTPGGYRRLMTRLEKARDAYFQVCASNEDAAGAGDSSVWHDNFAYEENQRQMHQLARRVRDLEVLMNSVRVVQVPPTPPESVRLGARVRVRYDVEDQEQVLFIGGYDDGNPSENRISYNSPLARALTGRQEGDVATFRVGPRVREVELLEILPPPPEEVAS